MFECWFTKILVVLVAVTMASSARGEARDYPIAKEGCPDECGGVPIPFPFGIGDACFLSFNDSTDDAFRINCNHITNQPVPFLITGIELLSIDVQDSSLRVSSPVPYECYSNGKLLAGSTVYGELSRSGILLSERNAFVAVGCGTFASLWNEYGIQQTCNTSCIDLEAARNGTCDSLHGCCQAPIVPDSIYIYDQLNVNVSGASGKKEGCHYTFVSEAGWYNFSTTNLITTATDCDKMEAPLIYDWLLDSRYNLTCGSNTLIVDRYSNYVDIDGFSCSCLEGYTGNPYLPPGCQDINECLEERLNDCEKQEFCVNKKGGYECRCPDGHNGNGTITSPCVVVNGVGNGVAKPGCPAECSGVEIPFPFGIGPGCYAQGMSEFEIKCDSNATNPKPVLPFLGYREVLSINIEDHTLRLSYGVAYKCYNDRGLLPSDTTINNFTLDNEAPFSISATRNKFVAIGCVVTAWLKSDFYKDAYVCTTSCIDVKVVGHETCDSTLGCCESTIFGSLSYPSIYVGDMSNNQYNFNSSCFYAFVGEVGSYKFSTSNLTATSNDCDNMRVCVLYDWKLSTFNKSCSEATMKGDASYKLATICRSNTQIECIKEDVYSYRCQCLDHNGSNPYLPHGCQDINECIEERLNDCQKPEFCVNKNGGYDCKCPNGHHGNGTKASPCIPSPTNNLILGLSIGMSSMIGLILLYGLCKLLKRRKDVKQREHNFKKNGGLLLQQEMSTNNGAIDRTKIFSRSELERATDNFNNSRVLGCGGQGTVYKGMLVDGTIVAVKKSKKVDEHQLAQFINEVVILSQINHRNVVKLFGCCLETEVPLLVYEFVPNGTLYQYIHHPDEDFQLTWKVRLQIAVECAGAIAYLHSSCSSPIYHRDIKSSNILLDEKHKAKVSDFGTSRSISVDKTHVTTCVQGTFGYLDPEFFRSSHYSEKSDVYSFGVVLLELLTSKKPIFTDTSNEPRSLATAFIQLMEASPNELHSMLDAQVLQHCSEEEIEALATLVERCLSLSGKQRPTMREVATTLEMIKVQHSKEGDPTNDQEVNMEEGHVWNDEIDTTNGDTSIDTSSCNYSYSMNSQPLSVYCI